jgi:hypothetical protein
MVAKKSNGMAKAMDSSELLRDLLILGLLRSGAPQLEVRKLVGCSIDRVNRIAKVLKRAKTPNA